jgi:putative DNA primase/helicase
LVQLDCDNSLRFRFDPEAQQLFVEWLADLESKVRGGELHAALVSHLSKYRSLMPSLALLFELADRAAGGFDGFVGANPGESQNFCVSLEHAKQAAAWCDYLESHARRVYSCVTTSRMRAARELADKIRQRKVGANGSFTCRDVYIKGWSGLDSPEAVKLAVEVLQDAAWVREVVSEPGPFGGRPPNRYAVNPGVRR